MFKTHKPFEIIKTKTKIWREKQIHNQMNEKLRKPKSHDKK